MSLEEKAAVSPEHEEAVEKVSCDWRRRGHVTPYSPLIGAGEGLLAAAADLPAGGRPGPAAVPGGAAVGGRGPEAEHHHVPGTLVLRPLLLISFGQKEDLYLSGA